MKKFITLFFCCFCIFHLAAQDLRFARKIVDTLSSPYFWGRGYTNNGMSKAADFLKSAFKSYGLKPINGESFSQSFDYPINTFPGKMDIIINGKQLVPGKDFIVAPESKSISGKGELIQKDSITFINAKQKFIVRLEDKLTMDLSGEVADYSMIIVDKHAILNSPASFEANIENNFVKNFKAENILGVVKGTSKPDSIIIISAHYDHLGGLGKDTYFPGANDNASGISLLLNLAHFYATHPQPYSIGFICFAGEEAGLLDSKYFTEHPLIPLRSIRFLINTDLAGTGVDGITVVNATEFPNEFAWMVAINDEFHYLAKINPRGKAANSDHYFFSEKGVPAFFFYTLGGIKAYHDIYDRAETLPLNEHEDLFKLLVKFNEKLMKN